MASTPEEVELKSNAGGGKVQQMESGYGASPARLQSFFAVDFALRLVLFALSLSSLVVLVTSKQTVLIAVPVQPQLTLYVSQSGKFNHSPALIYLLVALSITTLYSIISLIISVASFLSKSAPSSTTLFKLLLIDLLLTGIMASATGSAGSIAYTGLKGNKHAMWKKICNVFDTFCWHVGSSIVLSLLASTVLLLLVVLSSFTIYRRSL